ncbi:MAG: hypothetical protein HY859_06805 [Caulobacterales bacterium]|nr:hypothetical protein [Caulobacterales bacterium]
MFQREATDAAQVQKGPSSTAIIFTSTPDGRRAMSRHLAMLGTTGVAIRAAEARLRWAIKQHRSNQDSRRRGWAYSYTPSLASSRAHVLETLDHLRFQRGRLDRGDDALVHVLDLEDRPLEAEPVLLSTFLKASPRPYDRRFDYQTDRAIRTAIIDGFGAYHGDDFKLVRVRSAR